MRTIKSKLEFERVFRQGKRANHPLVRMIVAPCNEGDLPRIAFVAPKRLGTAVFRNRSKRVLRAAAQIAELPGECCDVILFATKETATSHPEQVSTAIEKLFARARG